MRTFLTAAAAILALSALGLSAAPAFAQLTFGSPAGPDRVFTLHGGGITTGRVGNGETLTLPGGGQGLLMPNGNGTSTLTLPNGNITAVPTPR